MIVTEVTANVKTPRKPRSVRGRAREAALLLHAVVQSGHTQTHTHKGI